MKDASVRVEKQQNEETNQQLSRKDETSSIDNPLSQRTKIFEC